MRWDFLAAELYIPTLIMLPICDSAFYFDYFGIICWERMGNNFKNLFFLNFPPVTCFTPPPNPEPQLSSEISYNVGSNVGNFKVYTSMSC